MNLFRFAQLTNTFEPNLLRKEKDGTSEMEILSFPGEGVTLAGFFSNVAEKMKARENIVVRRFGYIIYINLFIVVGLTLFISAFDLKKTIQWDFGKFIFHYRTLAFLAFQAVLVVALWVFLAEREVIAYGSIASAILVGIAPNTLMKSTFFESGFGKAIGLQTIYNRIRLVINEGLDERIQEKKEVEDRVEKAESELGKRLVYATWLLEDCSWVQLGMDHGLVKEDFREGRTINPSSIIAEAANQIGKRDGKLEELEEYIDERIGAISNESLREELSEKHKDCVTAREEVEFVSIHFTHTPCMLVEKGFLSLDWRDQIEIGIGKGLGDWFSAGKGA